MVSMSGVVGDEQDLATRPVRFGRERLSLIGLLVATAVLYLWGLAGAGWTNEFYAAAAQAGTRSWKALLFGSLDAGNAITVDKPPAAMWVMGISGRLFGFHVWSLLLPQALMGVGTVALLYAGVRRWGGHAAALVAGAVLASTPVAALMFRYDNPDALLTLLLVAAAYCAVRAVDARTTGWWSASTGWLVLCAAALGFGFLTKMLQAFLVLPGFALVFLIAGAGGLWSRVVKLLTAGVALLIASGWYVALVALWPADSRPYIGGSTSNSLWQLAIGYNGMGRLLGGHGNPGSGMSKPADFSMGPGFGEDAGITRLFRGYMGTDISWLLPAALIGLVAGLWLTRRAVRTDTTRAAFVLWGGWLLGTGLVFSYMSGIIHSYYTVALAPGIAALVGLSVCELWSRREHFAARATMAAMSLTTGVWAWALLHRTPDWLPWLRWAVLIGSVLVAAVLLSGVMRSARSAATAAAAALVLGLAAPAACTIDTIARTHTGGIPNSGPAKSMMPPMFGGGIMSTELDHLIGDAPQRWSAAMVGAGETSELELRTGRSVMALGGFTGSDDYPSLAQFQRYVTDGRIAYLILDERPGRFHPKMRPTDSYADLITAWVKATYPATKIGDATVYDLTTAAH